MTQSPLKERIFEYFDSSSYPSGTNETNWCAAFVNWCFLQTKENNLKTPAGNVGSLNWLPPLMAKTLDANKTCWSNGELVTREEDVFVGAIMVTSSSHIAVIVGQSADGKRFSYLGGNQSDGGPGDGPGKRTICVNSRSKSGMRSTVSKGQGKVFWIVKPKGFIPSDDLKQLPVVKSRIKKVLSYSQTHS